MEPFFLWPALAALIYATAALVTKRALSEGVGVMRFTFICNAGFLLVFGLPALSSAQPPDWSQVHWPVLGGVCFFLGQIFTVAAIRLGDVSIQSPLMGSKVIFVAALSVATGAEAVGPSWWAAAAITTGAVFLLGYSSWEGVRRIWTTIGLALSSALFFALSDVLVIAQAAQFGSAAYLGIVMAVQMLLSLLLLPAFRNPLSAISKAGWVWLVCAAGLMALQALILNTALALYQHGTAFNVIYSSRGLWSLLLLGLFGGFLRNVELVGNPRLVFQRFLGAGLLLGAVALVVFG